MSKVQQGADLKSEDGQSYFIQRETQGECLLDGTKTYVRSVLDVRISPPWNLKRTIVKKCEESTDPKYGHKPTDRPIKDHLRFGIINLDKPAGPSSHEVTAWTKKILGAEHAGHGGTLEAVSAGKIP